MVQSERPHHLLPPRSASDPNHRRDRKKSLSSRPSPSPIQKPLDNDDKASLHSHDSTGSSGNVQTADLLRGVTGDRVRHGNCAPEFLEAIAFRGDKHLKILTGTEASSFFLKYIGEQDKNDASGMRSVEDRNIVFAVTAYERGRKCVDYYMTWRRKNNHSALNDETVTEIDEEFRRVSRRIDGDFKAFRKAGGAPSSTTSHGSRKRDRSRSRSPPKKHRPQALPLTIDEPTVLATADDLPAPPASATDSVISLPYLNMVRGVPRAHRVPLFITNPDRLSTYTEMDSPLETPTTSIPEETVKTAKPEGPFVFAITPPDTNSPHGGKHDHERSGLTPLMKSSASIRSTGTHSSRSSRSSAESGHSSLNRSPSSQYDGKLPSVEENWKFDYLIVLLGDTFQKEGLSWHGLERQPSSRSNHRSRTKEPSSPWFGTLNKTEPPTPIYHGALQPQRQLHLQQMQRSKSLMAAVPTNHPPPPTSNGYYSDDSSEDERWGQDPVVPLKPMLDAMGFVPSPASQDHLPLHHSHHNGYAAHSPAVIPLGMPLPYGQTPQHYPMSLVGSPMHTPTRQLSARHSTYAGSTAPSAMSGASPYVPAWMALPPSSVHGGSNHGGSPAGSHPPSRAPSSAGGYGTPYMRHAY